MLCVHLRRKCMAVQLTIPSPSFMSEYFSPFMQSASRRDWKGKSYPLMFICCIIHFSWIILYYCSIIPKSYWAIHWQVEISTAVSRVFLPLNHLIWPLILNLGPDYQKCWAFWRLSTSHWRQIFKLLYTEQLLLWPFKDRFAEELSSSLSPRSWALSKICPALLSVRLEDKDFWKCSF